MRVVVDTNLWVSYLLQPSTPLIPRLDAVISDHTILYSHATLAELADVLTRPKFAKFIDLTDARAFIEEFIEIGEEIAISDPIHACRDPRDNKFLEIAVYGQADCILSGDRDLLDLHPFRGIRILQLANFPS